MFYVGVLFVNLKSNASKKQGVDDNKNLQADRKARHSHPRHLKLLELRISVENEILAITAVTPTPVYQVVLWTMSSTPPSRTCVSFLAHSHTINFEEITHLYDNHRIPEIVLWKPERELLFSWALWKHAVSVSQSFSCKCFITRPSTSKTADVVDTRGLWRLVIKTWTFVVIYV